MTWDPRAMMGGFQPGGIMGGAGQAPQMPTLPNGRMPVMGGAAGGGMPSLQDFWSRVQNAGGQVHDGLRNARMDFRDGLVSRLGQLPGMMGMQPRPGGTAGGGWAMPQHFQMPQGFAAHMPWGAPGGGPGAMGGTVPNGIAAGEPNPAAGGGGAARGNYVNKDPAARDAAKKKAEEIGKNAKGY